MSPAGSPPLSNSSSSDNYMFAICVFLVTVFLALVFLVGYDACGKLHAISSVSNFLNQLLGRGGHHNEERFRCLTSSNSSTASNPKHAIFGFLIAVLLALLPLKFGSMNPPVAPFETYSAILSTFLIITVLYAVAWAIETKLGTNNNSYRLLMSNISFLLGGLATVLLVLILVPGLGYFALVIWTLFLVKFIYEACQKLHQLYGAISLASNLWNELRGRGRGRGGHGGDYQNEGRIMLPV